MQISFFFFLLHKPVHMQILVAGCRIPWEFCPALCTSTQQSKGKWKTCSGNVCGEKKDCNIKWLKKIFPENHPSLHPQPEFPTSQVVRKHKIWYQGFQSWYQCNRWAFTTFPLTAIITSMCLHHLLLYTHLIIMRSSTLLQGSLNYARTLCCFICPSLNSSIKH